MIYTFLKRLNIDVHWQFIFSSKQRKKTKEKEVVTKGARHTFEELKVQNWLLKEKEKSH